MDRRFLLLGLVVLGSRALVLGRSQWGAELGIELGPQGYVLDTGSELRVLGNNKETIEYGDRVVAMAGRSVNSLAEIGDILRSLDARLISRSAEGEDPVAEPVEVPLTLERYRFRFTEILELKKFEESGLPDSVEPEDRIIGYSGRQVQGELDEDAVASVLARAGGPVDFVFERPVHRYQVRLPLQEPRLPVWPIALFVVGLAVVGWAARTSAKGVRDGPPVLIFAVAAAALPWALTLLADPAGALSDPLILLPGLVGLAMYRPLALEVHRRLRGGRSLTAGGLVLLPAAVLAVLGLGLGVRLLAAGFGGTVEPGAEAQIIDIIRATAALIAVYHVVDLVLWFSRGRAGNVPGLKWSQLGLLVSTLAVLTSLLFWVRDPMSFAQGGFVLHVAGHLLVVFLGDLALLAIPAMQTDAVEMPRAMALAEARERAGRFMENLSAALHPDDPVVVVVRGRMAVGLAVSGEVRPITEVVRDAVGVFRDEGISFPMPVYEGDDDNASHDLGEGVARSVGLTTAFLLADEGASANGHAEREAAFYAYCIVEGGSVPVDGRTRHALIQAFETAWPAVRAVALDAMLSAPGDLAAPRPQAAIAAEAPAAGPLELGYLRRDLGREFPVDDPDLVGPEMEATLRRYASVDAPLLVVGSAGAGKEFYARALHAALGQGAFIKFPVSSTPPSLVAVELLGDGEGDAQGHRAGHLQAASGGVLYVEDAGELRDELLAQLLTMLGTVAAGTRVVLGVRQPSDAPLDGALGKLASSALADRVVRLPELGADPARLRYLTDHYLLQYAMKHGRLVAEATDAAHAALADRSWVGGVRELKAAVEAAVLRCRGERLEPADLAGEVSHPVGAGSPPVAEGDQTAAVVTPVGEADDLRSWLWEAQRAVYDEALRRAEGNKSAAARLVGVKRSTFIKRLKEGQGDAET